MTAGIIRQAYTSKDGIQWETLLRAVREDPWGLSTKRKAVKYTGGTEQVAVSG